MDLGTLQNCMEDPKQKILHRTQLFIALILNQTLQTIKMMRMNPLNQMPIAHQAMNQTSRIDFRTVCHPANRKCKNELPKDFSPHAYSVILGRGKISDNVGNRRLKIVVDIELRNYQKAQTRRDKSFVVARVLDTFQSACDLGAFVRCEKGIWFEVPDTEAREKISTMFRDRLSHQYKSSTSNKVERRRQRKALEKQSSSFSTAVSYPDTLMDKSISYVNSDLAGFQVDLEAADSVFAECNSMISV